MQDEKVLQERSVYIDDAVVEMLAAQKEAFEEMCEADKDFIFDDYENEIQEDERYQGKY